MTSLDCLSGTDRLTELKESGKLQGDIWVNWQGDEPFIHQRVIEDLLQSVEEKKFDVYTLKKQIESPAMVEDPNTVKVVTDPEGRALYFSRAPIPHHRDNRGIYYKHIGIYAYTQEALAAIANLSPTPLELAEKLEQLRFLENGLTLQVHETKHETHGIDTPEDLIQALNLISSNLV